MRGLEPSSLRLAVAGVVVGVGACTVPVDLDTSVESVSVEPVDATLAVGDNWQLRATATWSDQSTTDVTVVSDWGSSNESAGTVDAVGLVTARAEGAFDVTAAYLGVTGTARVQAWNLLGLAFEPIPDPIAVGGSGPTVLLGEASSGDSVDLTKAADYVSSDPLVATISNEEADRGTVTARAPGDVTFTATFGSRTAALQTEVVEAPQLELRPGDPVLEGGETRDMEIWASAPVIGDWPVEWEWAVWESSDPGVATVDGKGRVTAVAPGTTTVTARTRTMFLELEVSTTITVTDMGIPLGSGRLAVASNAGVETFSWAPPSTFERGPVRGTGTPPGSLHADFGFQWLLAPRIGIGADVTILESDPARGDFTVLTTVDIEGGSIGATAYDEVNRVLGVSTLLDRMVGFYTVDRMAPYITKTTGPLDATTFFATDIDIGPTPGGERVWTVLGNGALGVRAWRMASDLSFDELTGSGYEPRTPSVRLHVDPYGSGCAWTFGNDGIDAFQIDADGGGMTPVPRYPVTSHGARSAATTGDGRVYFAIGDGSSVHGYRFGASCELTGISGSPWDTEISVLERLMIDPDDEAIFGIGFDPALNEDYAQGFWLQSDGPMGAPIGVRTRTGDFARAMTFVW